MNKTWKSFGDRRLSNASTPLSISSKKYIQKQQVSIEDIYSQVKQKISEMQSAFKSQHCGRQRQMLKTYVKILDKIGAKVMKAKQKYLNLDKQNLKTDKRLQIVTQLNKQRQKCNNLTKNIKTVKQQIKRYQDQNTYLEKQVQALQNIAMKKKSLSKSQHIKYRNSKQKAKSLQKRWNDQNDQNQKFVFISKKSGQLSNGLSNTFDVKNRVKSFMVNSQQPNGSIQISQFKTQHRPHTQQKYIGNKRRKNKYFNVPLQQNCQLVHLT